MPKRDWLNFAVTTKARNKIRQSLHEQEAKNVAFAKEDLERKFKHHKIEPEEGTLMRMVKKLGYKQMNDFYKAIAEGSLDSAYVVEKYKEQVDRENNPTQYSTENRSADGFVHNVSDIQPEKSADVLVIDNSVKGVEYSLAKCCNPIYGDDVFGFVTVNRGIKIHRTNCPNAERLKERMSYRVIRAQWAGKGSSQYAVSLHVVGNDDIGIVNNLTSIINKEKNIVLRGISIQSSEDGLFSGTLTVMIDDNKQIEQLIKRLQTVKGIKNITR